MTEETKDRVTFVEFARERMGTESPCTCGAKSGHAHPETCEQRRWWDRVWREWSTSGRCLVNLGHWVGK